MSILLEKVQPLVSFGGFCVLPLIKESLNTSKVYDSADRVGLGFWVAASVAAYAVKQIHVNPPRSSSDVVKHSENGELSVKQPRSDEAEREHFTYSIDRPKEQDEEEEEKEEVKLISGIINPPAPGNSSDIEDEILPEFEDLLSREIDFPLPNDKYDTEKNSKAEKDKVYEAEMAINSSELERLRTLVKELEEREVKLEADRNKIKELQRQFQLESNQTKGQLLLLKQQMSSLQSKEEQAFKKDVDVEKKLKALKELEVEVVELKRKNKELQHEKRGLTVKLDAAKARIMALSNMTETEMVAKAREEVSDLKHANEDLLKQVEASNEQVQRSRGAGVPFWVNACLRYELCNYQTPSGKASARDLSKSMSPRSQEKAKQLMFEYAGSERGQGDTYVETNFSHPSSPGSDDFDNASIDSSISRYISVSKKPSLIQKLKKLGRSKDDSSALSSPSRSFGGSSPSRASISHSRPRGPLESLMLRNADDSVAITTFGQAEQEALNSPETLKFSYSGDSLNNVATSFQLMSKSVKGVLDEKYPAYEDRHKLALEKEKQIKEKAEQARALRFGDGAKLNSSFESKAKPPSLPPKLTQLKEKVVVSNGTIDQSNDGKTVDSQTVSKMQFAHIEKRAPCTTRPPPKPSGGAPFAENTSSASGVPVAPPLPLPPPGGLPPPPPPPPPPGGVGEDVPGEDISKQSLIDEEACEFEALERDYSGGTYDNLAPNGKLTMSMVMDALFNEEARRREMGTTDQSESHALVLEGSRERGRGYHKVLTTCVEIERCSLHMHHARDVYGWRTTQLAELLANDQSGSAWQTGDSKGCSFDASGGILRVSKGNKEMLWGKKTGGLYRLEGSVQIGGATVRHGSSGTSKKNGQGKQPLHRGMQSKHRGTWGIRNVQDVHREVQRKETKRRDGATTTRKVTYFVAYPSRGCRAPQLEGAGTSSYGGAGLEAIRKDNLKTSDYPLVGWRGRLLSPAHLDESKLTWMSPSPVAKSKPGRVGCLDFLRALRCGLRAERCGLRAECCEVRLRGKTEEIVREGVKAEVETQGDCVQSLATEVRAASFTSINDLVSFVNWLDEELSFLVDERAVLKHFDWPEGKADALREAAFEYQDLMKLQQQVASFDDDPKFPCDPALKKMYKLREKVEQSVYALLRTRDRAISRYREFGIRVDWLMDSGVVGKIKLSSVQLAKKYMKRVASELDAMSGSEKEPNREFLLLQGVHFAFRVHQAFEELRGRVRAQTGDDNKLEA
ncbi:hydroxyproline-rich glycoprotein family protein [Actinidia rufa]|uniref:Hydroxyproline-rich glycoprotein family protein n=1 Tax=Actinidia rufa TaxID=165716 RepID=A0A7J0H606_9ERIC|nr:hydroxyproline-rich glycoprotein family protein [Actinidia rufa]